uniref:Uncharacterized protein n=1 Tax=Glossina brevipalpis TaxID=37001 RepID=A0A1A9WDP7_9MUSC
MIALKKLNETLSNDRRGVRVLNLKEYNGSSILSLLSLTMTCLVAWLLACLPICRFAGLPVCRLVLLFEVLCSIMPGSDKFSHYIQRKKANNFTGRLLIKNFHRMNLHKQEKTLII